MGDYTEISVWGNRVTFVIIKRSGAYGQIKQVHPAHPKVCLVATGLIRPKSSRRLPSDRGASFHTFSGLPRSMLSAGTPLKGSTSSNPSKWGHAFVVRRHRAIKRSRLLDQPGAIILLRRKPATEMVVSHFPSGRWPILEAVLRATPLLVALGAPAEP
jgi:hypothetical protein